MRLLLLLIFMSLVSCSKDIDKKYLITKHQVGLVTDSTQVYQLPNLFSNDSLVVRLEEGEYVEAENDSYLVYDKSGELLLTAIAKVQGDTTSVFKSVVISSKKYKTINGLTNNSYYIDIKGNKLLSAKKKLPSEAILLLFDSINASMLLNNKLVEQASTLDSIQANEFTVIWD